jgi:hypothetical protein
VLEQTPTARKRAWNLYCINRDDIVDHCGNGKHQADMKRRFLRRGAVFIEQGIDAINASITQEYNSGMTIYFMICAVPVE